MRIRSFTPNDIPAIATVVRESLRENYPTSLYLDIHRWWREGFLIAELAKSPIEAPRGEARPREHSCCVGGR
ncbi:MAG TPA: hypothetical protein VFA17_07130 [Thermoplasmata archaeon]|nr:hypothetical protein [Thermoplasmata archaeon]